MPHYLFNLYNDLVVNDLEGADLPDDGAARAHAIKNIRSLMCETIAAGHLNLAHRIDVADEQGEALFAVPFAEAVTISH